jgi:hypothetical protein
MFILLPATASALPHGTLITNLAVFRSDAAPEVSASVSVRVVARTPSRVELLKYSPNGTPVNVPSTSFSSSGAAEGPFQILPAPTPLGGTQPFSLEDPLPLATSGFIKGGDPLFIRLTDLDQNLNPNTAETIVVRVTETDGDSELLLLTETGPNTGVFAGYLPTQAGSAPSIADGLLTVAPDGQILVTYTDSVDLTDGSSIGALVDPVGKIIDSATGLPVNGAAVTLINADTGLPATVFGDDGVSTYPSTVVSGGSVTDSSGTVYNFPLGGFRFPLINPGNYRLQVEPPPG